jgi:hypothetical protein
MSLLTRNGRTIELEDRWPAQDDLGRLVILPGGEAGILVARRRPQRVALAAGALQPSVSRPRLERRGSWRCSRWLPASAG